MKRRSYDCFWIFHTPKTFFPKTLKISAPNSFFPKNDQNVLSIGGLFKLCERSKKIQVEDRIQKTDREGEETVLDFLAQYEVYGYLKKWWWI